MARRRQRANVYRDLMAGADIKRLARASRTTGLESETELLRVLLQRAIDDNNVDTIVELTKAIARLEEAASRIRARDGDQDAALANGAAVFDHMIKQLLEANSDTTGPDPTPDGAEPDAAAASIPD